MAFAFQQTAVVPIIPTIQGQLHASQEWSAWLMSGYLVASSLTTPLLGKLGDRYGRRRLLLVAMGIFLIGSVGASLAPNLGILIGFRAVQGAGGAVFPLTLAVVRERIPPESIARGVGLLTGAFGMGTALGFGLAGTLGELLSWRWVFAAGAVAIGVAMVGIVRNVSGEERTQEVGLDLTGGALFGGGIALLLISLTEAAQRGWLSIEVVAGYLIGITLLGLWVVRDLRVDNPFVDLRGLARRATALTNAATLALGYSLFGAYFLIPYLAEDSHRIGGSLSGGAIAAGLYLLPAALGQVVGGLSTSRLSEAIGTHRVFALGMAAVTAGVALLAVWHLQTWQLLIATLLIGSGTGLAIGASSSLITRDAGHREAGVATAFNSVVRRVGGGVGGQAAAGLLVALSTTAGPDESAFVVAFGAAAAVAAIGCLLAIMIGEPKSRRSAST